MDRDEALRLLKGGPEGVAEWNWRRKTGEEIPRLKGASLIGANLIEANLKAANLVGANLRGASLTRADVSGASLRGASLIRVSLNLANLREGDLGGANLSGADLKGANLKGADLSGANLYGTDLSGANLNEADLTDADLPEANLTDAGLIAVNLSRANLSGADLSRARVGLTDFPESLGSAIGLEEVDHEGPSIVPVTALRSFEAKLPELFLRGCGLNDFEIEFAKMCVPDQTNEELQEINNKLFCARAEQPIQRRPVFISYSHGDRKFVDQLERHLDEAGIRYWRDVHDLNAGPVEKQLHRALDERIAIVVLSTKSIKSDWVEEEVEHSRSLEKEQGRHVICPIALDGAWKKANWEHRLMKQVTKNNVLDFKDWRDEESFKSAFGKLERGLRQWYQA